jgi:hypothetical protein
VNHIYDHNGNEYIEVPKNGGFAEFWLVKFANKCEVKKHTCGHNQYGKFPCHVFLCPKHKTLEKK